MHIELQEIANHIGETYKAINAKDRRQNEHSRLIRTLEPRIDSAAGEYFDLIEKEVTRGTRHMPRGTPGQIARGLADWKYIKEEGRKIFNEPLAKISVIGADKILGMRILRQRTDPIGEEATEWADEHAATLVTGITAETMDALREIIKNGIDQGLSLQQISPQLREMVGLNYRQAVAAGKLMTRLVDAGLAEADITRQVTRYANKAHRYRAMMIARTETAYALNNGTLQGYQKMGIMKVQWWADAQACPICTANDTLVYTLAESWGLMPAHPNCECVWVMAT